MRERTYILQIETATPVCSVAVSQNGETIALMEADGANLHASHLTLFIEQVLADVALSLDDLSAVAVSMGPGSYTGLRIGVSTAKGLCYALDIPLLAVPTLEAMVYGYVTQGKIPALKDVKLVPMIDARRMEVYMMVFNAKLDILGETEARIIDATSFSDAAQETPYILFGSGADKFEPIFEEDKAVCVESGFRNSASFLSTPASERFEQGRFEDVIYFEPYYLKDFIATTPKKRS